MVPPWRSGERDYAWSLSHSAEYAVAGFPARPRTVNAHPNGEVWRSPRTCGSGCLSCLRRGLVCDRIDSGSGRRIPGQRCESIAWNPENKRMAKPEGNMESNSSLTLKKAED